VYFREKRTIAGYIAAKKVKGYIQPNTTINAINTSSRLILFPPLAPTSISMPQKSNQTLQQHNSVSSNVYIYIKYHRIQASFAMHFRLSVMRLFCFFGECWFKSGDEFFLVFFGHECM
jgi:hypothetical protein